MTENYIVYRFSNRYYISNGVTSHIFKQGGKNFIEDCDGVKEISDLIHCKSKNHAQKVTKEKFILLLGLSNQERDLKIKKSLFEIKKLEKEIAALKKKIETEKEYGNKTKKMIKDYVTT